MKANKFISIALSAALVIASALIPAPASAAAGGTSMKLWYDEPASQLNGYDTWQQATLPIGNGKLGANVYGELDTEHLTVNEETLWSGGRGSVNNYNGGNPSSSMVGIYNSLANYYLNGTYTYYDIEDLAGVPEKQSGYDNGYQPLGDLYVTFGHGKAGSYTRELDLESGISSVDYTYGNVSYSRKYFASNPDNVLVSHFEAGTGKNLGFTVEFYSQQNASTNVSVKNNVGYITIAGTVDKNGLLHNTQLAVVSDGTVTAQDKSITVSGASTATVYLTAATDYENTYWNDNQTISYYYRTGESAGQLSSRVKEVLDAAVNKGYETILARHTADYTSLYNRVNLNLGQSNLLTTDELLDAYKGGYASAEQARYLEVLVYQYGRYLLIAGSRENSQLPTTLQGIWNNNTSAPWKSDIHTNINLEMNYWLSNNANLTECALPLVEYMSDLAIPGGRTVEIYTGVTNGIMAHTQNTPYGYTSPGWDIGTWGWSPAAATWLLQNCFDYYEYSGDTDTLRSTIYPMLKDQVLMYQQLLKKKDGRLVMPITQSPELATITAGNTYEQSLIWQLYSDTIEAANILGVDSDQVATWKTTMDQLKPVEIGSSGQIKEWYSETRLNSVENTSSHRHLSNLLCLFPGNLIDTEEEINAAIVSLNNKNFGRVGTYNNPEGGWTYGQLINSWARVGSGENAYFSVKTMLQNRLYDNLWDWHTSGYYGAFQIDGNYGYSAGVGEMLLQSNLGYINLLPAIPGEWATGSVKGLLAEGGFEVDMNWSNSKLTDLSITSTKGGECSVQYPVLAEDKVLKITSNGADVVYELSDGIYTFDTSAGSVYSFTVVDEDVQEPDPDVPTEPSEPDPDIPTEPSEPDPDVPTVPSEPETKPVTAQRNADGSVILNWSSKEGVTYTITRKELD